MGVHTLSIKKKTTHKMYSIHLSYYLRSKKLQANLNRQSH